MTVRTALGLINEVLGEVLDGEEAEFDADTRFALTWFEQYGHNPGPFGDADMLARAKNTSVAGVAGCGYRSSRDGKVRLFERHELTRMVGSGDRRRLTVWEATQHLIRALDAVARRRRRRCLLAARRARRACPSARVPAVRDVRPTRVGGGGRRLQQARHGVAGAQPSGARPSRRRLQRQLF